MDAVRIAGVRRCSSTGSDVTGTHGTFADVVVGRRLARVVVSEIQGNRKGIERIPYVVTVDRVMMVEMVRGAVEIVGGWGHGGMEASLRGLGSGVG